MSSSKNLVVVSFMTIFMSNTPRGFIDNTASPEANYVLVIWICKEGDNGATSLIYFNGNRCACTLETTSVSETVHTVDINFPSPMECVFQARG